MDLANMLFGFFKTQDGSDEGAAGAATALSACAIEKNVNEKGRGWWVQGTPSGFHFELPWQRRRRNHREKEPWPLTILSRTRISGSSVHCWARRQRFGALRCRGTCRRVTTGKRAHIAPGKNKRTRDVPIAELLP